jgi:hypothetical protein
MLLFQAAGSKLGIVVATCDIVQDLQRLYAAYRIDKASLPPLEFRKSPWKPREEIWIVRVERETKPDPGAPPPPAVGDIDLEALSLGDLGL